MGTDASAGNRRDWKTALDAATSLVMMGAAVTLVWLHVTRGPSTPEPSVPSDPVSIDTAALKGSSSAPAVMIVFSDFECPFCGRFARETMPQLEREYVGPGRLQLAHRYLPLDRHPNAPGAAQAAECSGRQGQFWPMHDRLFTTGAQIDAAGVQAIAAALDLDAAAFMACLEEPASRDAVSRDLALAEELGLTNTPAFLLGTRISDGRVQVSRAFYGARPIDEFRAEIERAMKNPAAPSWFRGVFGLWSAPTRSHN